MVKPRVLLDCDGVLADFHTPCLEIINELTHGDFKHSDVTKWDIFDSLNVSDEVRAETYKRMNSRGWCTALKPYDGAISGVKQLMEIADVHIVTAPMRGETWHSERETWLWNYFSIPSRRVTHTSAKHIVYGDALIDDRESNLVSWRAETINRYGHAIKWRTYLHQECSYDGFKFADWPSLLAWLVEWSQR